MTEFTEREESQLRALTDAAYDAKGTPEYHARCQAVVDWYVGLEGRRLATRVAAGEQFLKGQHGEAPGTGP